MKLIEACVKPELADKVIHALEGLKIKCVSVIDVKAVGEDACCDEWKKDYSVEYGTAYCVCSKIKVFCDDSKIKEVFKTIKEMAHTGHAGDGFISIVSLEEFQKI